MLPTNVVTIETIAVPSSVLLVSDDVVKLKFPVLVVSPTSTPVVSLASTIIIVILFIVNLFSF